MRSLPSRALELRGGALFLNDGRTIVSAAGTIPSGSGTFSARTLTSRFLRRHMFSLSPDGRWLAVGRPWQLFDTARLQLEYTGTNWYPVGGLVFSPTANDSARCGVEIRVLEMLASDGDIIDGWRQGCDTTRRAGLFLTGRGGCTVRRTRPSGSPISSPGRS
jgi:hypothetical protein